MLILIRQALDPQPAEPLLGITRQWQTGFVLGGDVRSDPSFLSDHSELIFYQMEIPINVHKAERNDEEANPEVQQLATPSPERPDSPKGGTPPLPIAWERAPRDTRIEDMPGFRYFVMQDGHRRAMFYKQTWKEGFTRGLRRHIIRRTKRED